MSRLAGRHFIQTPGPTNVPDRVLRAIDRPMIDQRGPVFASLQREVVAGCRTIFRAAGPVMIYASSGSGAWEAALVNTLSPGDKVLTIDTGHFAITWRRMAETLGLRVEAMESDWRHSVDLADLERRLVADRDHEIRAVLIVHNETSSGVVNRLPAVRAILDRVGHPALFMVDAISSVGAMPYEHDAWGIDVTVAACQKGLMMPPGLGFNVVSSKALKASETARLPRAYWRWEDMMRLNADGFYQFTPAINMFFGLREAIAMLHEEGLEAVFARHARLAAATRAAVRAWGLELVARNPADYSDTVTAVFVPEGHNAEKLRAVARDGLNFTLGAGIGRLHQRAFRIAHLGDLNEVMLTGVLAGIEMAMKIAHIPYRAGGVDAAMDVLAGAHATPALDAAAD